MFTRKERVFDLLQYMSATSAACAADTAFSPLIFVKSRLICIISSSQRILGSRFSDMKCVLFNVE